MPLVPMASGLHRAQSTGQGRALARPPGLPCRARVRCFPLPARDRRRMAETLFRGSVHESPARCSPGAALFSKTANIHA